MWAVMHLVLVGLAVGALLDMLLRGALACFARCLRLLWGTGLGFGVHLGDGRIVNGLFTCLVGAS